MIRDFLDILDGDFFRVIYLLGSGGGIWFWVDKWRSRSRVRIRLVDVKFLENTGRDRLCFELTNLGVLNTSVDERIEMTGISLLAVNDKKACHFFSAITDDRLLEPHKPKLISFDSESSESHAFFWYCRYRLNFTRGCSQSICVKNVKGDRISRFKLELERIKICIFGVIPKDLH